jgi:hypothetical protein
MNKLFGALSKIFLKSGGKDSLKLKIFEQKLDLNDISRKFKKPIFISLDEKRDSSKTLLNYATIDLNKGAIKYIINEESNFDKLKEFSEEKKKSIAKKSPHSVISLSEDEMSLFSYHPSNYVCHLNLKNKILDYVPSTSLQINESQKARDFCCTVYKSPSNKKLFYFSLILEDEKGSKLVIYESDLAFKKIRKVGEIAGEIEAPHTVIELGGVLFISKEQRETIKIKSKNIKGKILDDLYFKLNGKEGPENKKEVEAFLREGDYEMINGEVALMDKDTGALKCYPASGAFTGHFEIDEVESAIYISNHNLLGSKKCGVALPKPAVLDKYLIKGNKNLEYCGKFECDFGYRFTSHKVYRKNGKPYIVTFGYPNRLIIIDGETMELVYWEDIGVQGVVEDLKFGKGIILTEDDLRISAMEVSEDGEALFFLTQKYFYLYDLVNRKLIQKIPYPKWDENIKDSEVGGFAGFHIQYLDYQ